MQRDKMRLVYTRNELQKYIVLIFSALVAVLIISISSSASIHVFSMWAFALIACILCGFNFFHPYFWFSIFFTLYSTANAILWEAGVRSGNYTKEQILYPVIALTVVLIVIGTKKNDNIYENREVVNDVKQDDERILKWVIIICALAAILVSFILRARGYTSKVDMRRSGDVFFRYAVHIVRFMTLFVILYVGKVFDRHGFVPWNIIIVGGIGALVFTLFTSERDVIFRFGYTVVLLLFAEKVLKPRHIPIVAISAILAMVLSVIIKHYFLRGILHTGTGNVLYDFLTSDFNAAGRNLQYLMDFSWTKGALGWKTLFTEIFEPILIGIKTVDPDHWFNYTVHTGGYKGYAFTLVGTGYAIAGLPGIVAVFIVVGVIVKFFYNRYHRSSYWLAAYIYLSSSVIFSFRQSLQTITGTIVDHIGLGILFCVLIRRIHIGSRR
ncbi:MAG: oligosaccharide repeat unit polymerase [Clostridia bacterium]|nr:oligosaccharide repeat unit polymerase [Clostridia bacterium]